MKSPLAKPHGLSGRLFQLEFPHKPLMRGLIAENPPGVVIHPLLDPQALGLTHRADELAFREEASDQLVLVLAGSPFPGAVRVAEVHVRHILQGLVQSGEFRAIVGGDGLEDAGKVCARPLPQAVDGPAHGVGILPLQLQDDLETRAPLDQRQQDGIRLRPVSDHGIDLPVAEGFPCGDRLRTRLDGSPQDFPVGALAVSHRLGLAGQLFEQVQIGGPQDDPVDPLVERGGAGDDGGIEQPVLRGKADDRIGRPLLTEHLVIRPGKERIRVRPFRAPAAVQPLLLVEGLSRIRIINRMIVVVAFSVLLLALQLGDGAAVDLVVYGLWDPVQHVGNLTVGILLLFQDGDLATLCVGKVFSLA